MGAIGIKDPRIYSIYSSNTYWAKQYPYIFQYLLGWPSHPSLNLCGTVGKPPKPYETEMKPPKTVRVGSIQEPQNCFGELHLHQDAPVGLVFARNRAKSTIFGYFRPLVTPSRWFQTIFPILAEIILGSNPPIYFQYLLRSLDIFQYNTC